MEGELYAERTIGYILLTGGSLQCYKFCARICLESFKMTLEAFKLGISVAKVTQLVICSP